MGSVKKGKSKFLVFVAIAGGLLLNSISAKADCLTQAQVDQILARHPILVKTNAGDIMKAAQEPIQKVDLCDSLQLSHQTVKALLFLDKSNSLGAAPPGGLDKNFLKNGPGYFLSQRIDKIVLEDPVFNGCGAGMVAYVFLFEQKTMHICPVAADLSTLQLADVLVHEARHTEGYSHVSCKHGPYSGYGACDSSVEKGGSYGVGFEFYLKISKSEEISKEVRQEARGEAVVDLLERFIELPLDLRAGL